jgi:hypothetical protein
MHPVQLWQCTWTLQVLLVSHALAIDQWMNTTSNNNWYTRNDSSHLKPHSSVYYDPKRRGIHSKMNSWCLPSTWWQLQEGGCLSSQQGQPVNCTTVLFQFVWNEHLHFPSKHLHSLHDLLPTTFACNELNKIQQKTIQAILNKLGVSKPFPWHITFGPKDLGRWPCVIWALNKASGSSNTSLTTFLAKTLLVIWDSLLCVVYNLKQAAAFMYWRIMQGLSYNTPCWLTLVCDFLAQHKILLTVAVFTHFH